MKKFILVSSLLMFSVAAYAADFPDDLVPFPTNKFILKPETREEVIRSYRRLITGGPVGVIEAKIAAQYELLRDKLERDYDLAKPKVIEKSADYVVVRFPSFFSFMEKKTKGQYLYCVNLKNGKINWKKLDPSHID